MQLLAVDISEAELAKTSKALLKLLLKNQTTKKNIVWASPSYEGLGKPFCAGEPIELNLIIGKYDSIIQPRVEKNKRTQELRTKKRAEVFTPIWIVDKQVKIVENEMKDISFSDYIKMKWLELACGEGPYIVTRYDTTTGELIAVEDRVGFLDRKLQRIYKEIDNEKEFINWTKLAYQCSYGYELQGDSLLLARENLLLSFYEYYQSKFNKSPEVKVAKEIAKIISFNLIQMNGLTNKIPYSASQGEGIQLSLFDTNHIKEVEDELAEFYDWTAKQFVRIDAVVKGEYAMKFDVVIGNPPYQEDTEGTSDKPIYNYMMDAAEEIGDRVCMITPARFLFNAGKTKKDWNHKKLSDKHFKVSYYEQDSSKVFSNTDIKGGIAITYRDENKDFGEIGTFTAFIELNFILKKVIGFNSFESFSDLIVAPESYKLTDKLHSDYPEAESKLSKGHKYDVTTNIFEKLPEVFINSLSSNDDKSKFIKIVGRENNTRAEKWIKKEYIVGPDNLNGYKVILPKSNGSGAIGEVLSTPLIGEPLIGHTQTFISVGNFLTIIEANACLKYIKTKFARTLLGVLKITQHNPKATWKYVPLQDFTVDSDIDWSQSIADIDRQLYAKYKLSQEEIDFIEEKVRAMD